MTEPDPFAVDPIERDGRGRPLIIPLKARGKTPDLKAKPVPYTRVSTFAKALDDPGGLATWRLRHAAIGFGRNEELAAMAGVFGPTLGDCSNQDKAELDRIIELAHQASGGNVKANHGSAMHGITEPDRDPFVPARMAAQVQEYNDALQVYGLTPVATEQFIVNDEFKVAGTFDHAYKLTRDLTFSDGVTITAGEVLIGDKKTGTLHFVATAIQLACYATGSTYDPETGERTPLDVSKAYGVIVHIPKPGRDGESAPVALYRVDLSRGYTMARAALNVRHWNSAAGEKETALAFTVVDLGPITDEGNLAAAIADSFLTPLNGELQPVRPVAHSAAIAEKLQAAAAQSAPVVVPEPVIAPVVVEPAAVVAEPTPDELEDEFAALLGEKLGAVKVKPISDQLEACMSRDELAAVWRANKDVWTEAHTVVLKALGAQFAKPDAA